MAGEDRSSKLWRPIASPGGSPSVRGGGSEGVLRMGDAQPAKTGASAHRKMISGRGMKSPVLTQ